MARNSEDTPRIEFTPKERGSITRKFHEQLTATARASAHFSASKRGHKYKLDYNPLAKDAPICWSVCVNRHWVCGNSSTVFDALECIAHKIAHKELDKRLAAMENEEEA
jgi:hypothetical protein